MLSCRRISKPEVPHIFRKQLSTKISAGTYKAITKLLIYLKKLQEKSCHLPIEDPYAVLFALYVTFQSNFQFQIESANHR